MLKKLKLYGIVKANEEFIGTSMGGIGYKHSLEEYVINKINDSEIAKEQKAHKKINVFTGMEFNDKNQEFSFASLSDEQKAYLSSLSQEELAEMMKNYSENNNATYEENLSKLGIANLDEPKRN